MDYLFISRADNKLWEPNQNTWICSEHFIDGKPSKHPNSPSFYPQIFPKMYKQKIPSQESVNRLKRRKSCSTAISTDLVLKLQLFQINSNILIFYIKLRINQLRLL